MIPSQFDYHAPTTLAEAVALLSRFGEGAKVLSGGQSLLPLLKLRLGTAEHLVDIGRIPGLEYIKEEGGVLKIGGRTRESALEQSELVKAKAPILHDTARVIADPLVRNLATVGGNLLQRTRCTYFRDTAWSCNKRQPGSGCSALEGYNRSHALLGTSEKCIATHPSDMCVAMVALDAVIHTEGPKRNRKIAITDFYAKEPMSVPGSVMCSTRCTR